MGKEELDEGRLGGDGSNEVEFEGGYGCSVNAGVLVQLKNLVCVLYVVL